MQGGFYCPLSPLNLQYQISEFRFRDKSKRLPKRSKKVDYPESRNFVLKNLSVAADAASFLKPFYSLKLKTQI